MKHDTARILLVVVLVLIFLGGQQTIPKEAVADVEGLACNVDADCPCWGKLEGGVEAYGVGVATCTDENVCNIDFCFDVEPVGEWIKDNPINWLHENTLMFAGILALTALVIFWPKR